MKKDIEALLSKAENEAIEIGVLFGKVGEKTKTYKELQRKNERVIARIQTLTEVLKLMK